MRFEIAAITNPGTTPITILAVNSDHGLSFAGEETRTMVWLSFSLQIYSTLKFWRFKVSVVWVLVWVSSFYGDGGGSRTVNANLAIRRAANREPRFKTSKVTTFGKLASFFQEWSHYIQEVCHSSGQTVAIFHRAKFQKFGPFWQLGFNNKTHMSMKYTPPSNSLICVSPRIGTRGHWNTRWHKLWISLSQADARQGQQWRSSRTCMQEMQLS